MIRARGARTIASLLLRKDSHLIAGSCWSAGGIWDTFTSVQSSPIGSPTWRTARTRALSWADQHPRTLPELIIASLSRGALWQSEKPAIRTRRKRRGLTNIESTQIDTHNE